MSGPERAREGAIGFAAALRDPAALPPGIAPGQRRRLDIHRNTVVQGMVEALRASFPAVERLVGGAFFAAMARAAIAADPPSSPLLFRYGGGFADFVESFPPAAGVPYLADVARLEWARLQAYHAADAAPLALADLAALPAEAMAGARLRLHPSFGLLRSRWPVFALWAASTGAGEPGAVDLARAEDVAVLRPHLAVETRLLADGAAPFLAALAAGETLGDAAGIAAEEDGDFDLGAHIAGLFEIGAVAGITAPGPLGTETTGTAAERPEPEGDEE